MIAAIRFVSHIGWKIEICVIHWFSNCFYNRYKLTNFLSLAMFSIVNMVLRFSCGGGFNSPLSCNAKWTISSSILLLSAFCSNVLKSIFGSSHSTSSMYWKVKIMWNVNMEYVARYQTSRQIFLHRTSSRHCYGSFDAYSCDLLFE